MKKSMIVLITAIAGLYACQTKSNHDGVYAAHIKGEYSVGNDTIIVDDTVITKRSSYQKIRNGQLRPIEYKTKIWTLHSLDAPVIQFEKHQLILGTTIYRKLP